MRKPKLFFVICFFWTCHHWLPLSRIIQMNTGNCCCHSINTLLTHLHLSANIRGIIVILWKRIFEYEITEANWEEKYFRARFHIFPLLWHLFASDLLISIMVWWEIELPVSCSRSGFRFCFYSSKIGTNLWRICNWKWSG